MPGVDNRLPDDTIGNTSQLPNRPLGLNLSDTVFFDTSVKRTAKSLGSAKFIADISKRWYNEDQTYKTFRYQHTITGTQLQSDEIYFGFSILFPSDYVPDGRTNVLYNFGGVGGGAFSVREHNGNFIINFSRGDENSTTNKLVTIINESTPGIWHDFIVYAKWSDNTNDGKLIVWINNK